MENFNNADPATLSLEELQEQLILQEKIINNLRKRLSAKEEVIDNLQINNIESQKYILGVLEDLQQAKKRAENIQKSTIWRLTTPIRVSLEKFSFLRRIFRQSVELIRGAMTFKRTNKLAQDKITLYLSTDLQTVDLYADLQTAREINLPQAKDIKTNNNKFCTIFFVSGDPDTPGHQYRIERYAQAAKAAGYAVVVFPVNKSSEYLNQITISSIIFLWRTVWCKDILHIYETAKSFGAKIIFDIDDYMFDPKIACPEIIDSIRSANLAEIQFHYSQIYRCFAIADAASAPTDFLAAQMRSHFIPSFVLPNGFNETILLKSRLAVRARRQETSDGLIRIGYAAGTRTHQKDFSQASLAIAKILHEYPQCRLVLFYLAESEMLDLSEFFELQGLEHQIEWRSSVSLEELPAEIARFDINIAPLDFYSVFCNAKSELKYFEAALVEIPTIASPTDPYARAIQHQVTGFLAKNEVDWYDFLKLLIENPSIRQTIGIKAYYNCLWYFGPERRAQLMVSLVEQLRSNPQNVANAFELELARQNRKFTEPDIPGYQILFEKDNLQTSPVTIIVPLYNYAGNLEEALDSIKDQTFRNLDLIIVDDVSTDNSLNLAKKWIHANQERFNRVILAKNHCNSGLSLTRNVGFHLAESPYILSLNPDNKFLSNCVEECYNVLHKSTAAFVYPHIQEFDESKELRGIIKFHPSLLISLNYIGAIALIRKVAWVAVGGYLNTNVGWEDYEFWCKCVELGLFGIQVPKKLAYYQVHKAAMLRTFSDNRENRHQITDIMQEKHSWLYLDRFRRSASQV